MAESYGEDFIPHAESFDTIGPSLFRIAVARFISFREQRLDQALVNIGTGGPPSEGLNTNFTF